MVAMLLGEIIGLVRPVAVEKGAVIADRLSHRDWLTNIGEKRSALWRQGDDVCRFRLGDCFAAEMVARSAAVAAEPQSTGIDERAKAILKGAARTRIDERLGDLRSRRTTFVLPDSSLNRLKIGLGYGSCHAASLVARNLNRAIK